MKTHQDKRHPFRNDLGKPRRTLPMLRDLERNKKDAAQGTAADSSGWNPQAFELSRRSRSSRRRDPEITGLMTPPLPGN
jgi:hypothetical protein